MDLIVELSDTPIEEKDRLRSCHLIYDNVLDYITDEVYDSNIPYEDAVKMFRNQMGIVVKYNEDENSITFVDIDSFFSGNYRLFKQMVKDATLEQFRNANWADDAKWYIEPLYGTYIHYCGDTMQIIVLSENTAQMKRSFILAVFVGTTNRGMYLWKKT